MRGRAPLWAANLWSRHRDRIQFDFVALHVRPEGAQESLLREDPLIERDLIRVVDDDLDLVDLYLPIARDRVTALKPNAIRRNVDATKGVVFFRDGDLVRKKNGSVPESISMFKLHAELRAVNGWSHIFWASVAADADLLNWLENEDLPDYL